MKFSIEIVDCENGYMIFEGNSLGNGYQINNRRAWIAPNEHSLGELVEQLARAHAHLVMSRGEKKDGET